MRFVSFSSIGRFFLLSRISMTGSMIVELLPYFDARMPPVVGIFPRVSGIIGLHHYSYYVGNYPIAKTITSLTVHNVVDLDAHRLVTDTRAYAIEVGLDV